MRSKNGLRIPIICQICGISKQVRPSESDGVFCSNTCRGLAMRGKKSWITGKNHTQETREKMSIAKKGKQAWNKGIKCSQWSEEKHWGWQGDKPSYSAVHVWIKKHLGKAKVCSFNPLHTSPKFEWANISGQYFRDPDDFSSLCSACHHQYDTLRKGKASYTRWRTF